MVKKAIFKKKLVHLIFLFILISGFLFGGIFVWLFNPLNPLASSVASLRLLNSKFFNPALNNNYLILLNELARKQIDITYLNFLDNESVEASLSSGVKVIFSLKKEPISLATSLQLILSRFRIEGRKVNKIDLRFKNPIVE